MIVGAVTQYLVSATDRRRGRWGHAHRAPTPVVVASVRRAAAMGEIFGHNKIKGGTRMGSWAANKGELVYFPEE